MTCAPVNSTLYLKEQMNLSRILSVIVAAIYIAVSYLSEGIDLRNTAIVFSVVAMIFIWFSDILGEFFTNFTGRGPVINTASPGWLVSFVAWVIFLIPLGIIIYNTVG